MIDAHALVLIGIGLLKRTEPTEEWKPSFNDTRTLREGMAKFQVEVINGKKQYPFEQYCRSKGIISFMDNGQIAVVSPEEWRRMNKTYSLLQWENEKEMDKMFSAYPEEKVAYESKLDVIRNEIRSLFEGMKVDYSKDMA